VRLQRFFTGWRFRSRSTEEYGFESCRLRRKWRVITDGKLICHKPDYAAEATVFYEQHAKEMSEVTLLAASAIDGRRASLRVRADWMR
jgi:hypothetical protein